MSREHEPGLPRISVETYQFDRLRRLRPRDIKENTVYNLRYKQRGLIDPDTYITDLYTLPLTVVAKPEFYVLGISLVDLAGRETRKIVLRPDGIVFNGRQDWASCRTCPAKRNPAIFCQSSNSQRVWMKLYYSELVSREVRMSAG